MTASDQTGYTVLLTDPSTHPFITDHGPVSPASVPERIQKNRRATAQGQSVYWSLEWSGEFVGFAALHAANGPKPVLAYAIVPAWRRRGLAREAIGAICAHALDQVGVEGLIARTHLDNDASAGLLLDLGFEEIGVVETSAGSRRVFERRA